MIKSIALMRRKPGLTHEEFKRHYEEVHAPLAARCLPGLKGYVRNYVAPATASLGVVEADFDVVSEFWYEDEAALKAVLEFLRTPAAQALREDEAKFIDSASIRAYVVDEHGNRNLHA